MRQQKKDATNKKKDATTKKRMRQEKKGCDNKKGCTFKTTGLQYDDRKFESAGIICHILKNIFCLFFKCAVTHCHPDF
jgi:hypothetical protein